MKKYIVIKPSGIKFEYKKYEWHLAWWLMWAGGFASGFYMALFF